MGQKHYRAVRARPSLLMTAQLLVAAPVTASGSATGRRQIYCPVRRFDILYGRKSVADMQRSYLG